MHTESLRVVVIIVLDWSQKLNPSFGVVFSVTFSAVGNGIGDPISNPLPANASYHRDMEYANFIPSREVRPSNKNGCSKYDTKLHLMVRLPFWRSRSLEYLFIALWLRVVVQVGSLLWVQLIFLKIIRIL